MAAWGKVSSQCNKLFQFQKLISSLSLYILLFFSIPCVNVIVLSQQEIKILKEKSFLTSLTPNRLMKSKSQTYTTHKCEIYTQTSSRSTTSLSRKNGK